MNKEHLQQINSVNNSVQQLTQTNTSQDINNCLKTSKISERKTNQMKIIDSINKSIDKKKSKSKDRVWKPFKCHFNDCDQRFLTLDVTRDHLKEHKTQNLIISH
jgi:hypothetical protein